MRAKDPAGDAEVTFPALLALLAQVAAALPSPNQLPPYVPPLTVLDNVLHLPPAEAIEIAAGRVSYGPAAHLRLTLALQLGEALSNERARVAWLTGWQLASDFDAGAFAAEHEKRLTAEADRNYTAGRLTTAEAQRWSVLDLAGAGSLVLIVGLGLGTAIGYGWGAP